jgi:hypothetical protein
VGGDPVLENTSAYIHVLPPTITDRTWVFLTEAAEGGSGISGVAFGREEFAALARGSSV